MNEIFDYLKIVFNANGFRLYMIGGTSRDYFLNRKIDDYDFVTDAKPSEIATFLKVDMTFSKFGTVKYYYHDKIKVDITTLRTESHYEDSRHPSEVEFVKDISKDYVRRDYTINAIYIDENYMFLDPSSEGINDLQNKVLRFIGDPLTRIKEDPLRILRGERFALEYGLTISEEYKKIFNDNKVLLNKINKDKIVEENRKLEKVKKDLLNESTKL